jgi:hypothetical protein
VAIVGKRSCAGGACLDVLIERDTSLYCKIIQVDGG